MPLVLKSTHLDHGGWLKLLRRVVKCRNSARKENRIQTMGSWRLKSPRTSQFVLSSTYHYLMKTVLLTFSFPSNCSWQMEINNFGEVTWGEFQQDKGSLWNMSKRGTASLTPGSSHCFQSLLLWPALGSTDIASATPSLPHSRLCQLKSKHGEEGKRQQKSSVLWFKFAKIFGGHRFHMTSIL